jgi:hypothetical protein
METFSASTAMAGKFWRRTLSLPISRSCGRALPQAVNRWIFSSRRRRFAPRPAHVRFVVEKVTLGQDFLRVLRFLPINTVSISGPYSRFSLLDILAHLRQKFVSKTMNYFYFFFNLPNFSIIYGNNLYYCVLNTFFFLLNITTIQNGFRFLKLEILNITSNNKRLWRW